MLARAGLGRSLPRAGLLMMIAANAPDADIVVGFGGTAAYLDYHRGITHALVSIPVMAALPVLIVWLLERRAARGGIPWLRLWLCSMIGVASHLLMDWTNSYGIRMLAPFSAEWLRLDTVFIVDPAIWVILLLGLAAPALGRLVSSEIGAKPVQGVAWPVFVLCLLLAYESGRYVAHDRAVAILDARIYNGGGTPLRAAAFARNSNPFAWKGVVETSGGYTVFSMNLLDEFDPASGRTFYKPPVSPAFEAAARTPEFGALLRFSSFPLWRVTPADTEEGASKVELFDLRFGTPASAGLAAAALVSASGVSKVSVGFGAPR